MAVLSLVIPVVKEYMEAKLPSLVLHRRSYGQTLYFAVLWVIVVVSALFAGNGLYEYYYNVYSPVLAKMYMAMTLLVIALGSLVSYLVVKGILRLFHRKKRAPEGAAMLEQSVRKAIASIEQEGINLIKQHPVAATLIGLSVGLLSGTMLPPKR